jgi:hypothetical protein
MLGVNQLTGFGANADDSGSGSASASITYVSSSENDTNATEYTFPAQNVGAAGTGRKVVVGCVSGSALTGLSATYDGAAMTVLAHNDAAGIAFFAIDESAAITAAIVVTNVATLINLRVFVWNVYNGAAAALDSQGDTTLTSGHNDITLTCPANSVALAIASYEDTVSTSPTTTWSGLTERIDGLFGDSSNKVCYSAADGTFATGASQAVSATYTIFSPYSGVLHGIVL